MITGPEDVIVLILLLLPLAAAGFLVITKSDSEADRVKRMQAWVRTKHETLLPERSYNKYLFRPFLWVLKPIATQTDKISNPHLSGAAWVFSTGYIALFLIFVALVIGWSIVVIALLIGALILVFAVLGESSDDDDYEYESRRERFSGMPDGEGRSVEREGIFGDKYVEHQDADGNVIGESREREGLFGGTYTEHTDAEGDVVGESREREGIFGDTYTEHEDSDSNIVGESREREGIFGDSYTEHEDSDGNLVAESRKREGLLGGEYTEHEEK